MSYGGGGASGAPVPGGSFIGTWSSTEAGVSGDYAAWAFPEVPAEFPPEGFTPPVTGGFKPPAGLAAPVHAGGTILYPEGPWLPSPDPLPEGVPPPPTGFATAFRFTVPTPTPSPPTYERTLALPGFKGDFRPWQVSFYLWIDAGVEMPPFTIFQCHNMAPGRPLGAESPMGLQSYGGTVPADSANAQVDLASPLGPGTTVRPVLPRGEWVHITLGEIDGHSDWPPSRTRGAFMRINGSLYGWMGGGFGGWAHLLKPYTYDWSAHAHGTDMSLRFFGNPAVAGNPGWWVSSIKYSEDLGPQPGVTPPAVIPDGVTPLPEPPDAIPGPGQTNTVAQVRVTDGETPLAGRRVRCHQSRNGAVVGEGVTDDQGWLPFGIERGVDHYVICFNDDPEEAAMILGKVFAP